VELKRQLEKVKDVRPGKRHLPQVRKGSGNPDSDGAEGLVCGTCHIGHL
jgi:hypothetical protein